MSILFLNFADQAEARAFLVALAATNNGLAKSAATHFAELAQFHATGAPGTPYLGVGLSATGYAAIGVNSTPADTSFGRGMTSPLVAPRDPGGAAGIGMGATVWAAHCADPNSRRDRHR